MKKRNPGSQDPNILQVFIWPRPPGAHHCIYPHIMTLFDPRGLQIVALVVESNTTNYDPNIFTEPAPRPVQFIASDVRVSLCLSPPPPPPLPHVD